MGYAAAIFVASSLPAPVAVPGGAALSLDKLLHVAEFAILGALVSLAIVPFTPRARAAAPWWGFVVAGAYGVFDEVHQAFVPTRVGDVWDAVADLAGAALGALLAAVVLRRFRTFADPSRPS